MTEKKADCIDIMHILIAYRLLTPPTGKSVNRGHNVDKNLLERLTRDKHSSLSLSFEDKRKVEIKIHNHFLFVTCSRVNEATVCLWLAFPAYFNIGG
jgi:hypothetical protein